MVPKEKDFSKTFSEIIPEKQLLKSNSMVSEIHKTTSFETVKLPENCKIVNISYDYQKDRAIIHTFRHAANPKDNLLYVSTFGVILNESRDKL